MWVMCIVLFPEVFLGKKTFFLSGLFKTRAFCALWRKISDVQCVAFSTGFFPPLLQRPAGSSQDLFSRRFIIFLIKIFLHPSLNM